MTGSSWGSSGSGCATIAYRASSGRELWTKRFEGCIGYALAVSPSGTKVFVAGETYRTTTGTDAIAIAYDDAWSVAVSPDGNRVFVTGLSDGSNTGGIDAQDALTVEYDASTGAKVWARRYDGPAGRQDIAWSVAATPDGTAAFVTGVSYDATQQNGITIAYAV